MRLGTYYRKKLLENLNIKTGVNERVLDVGCFDGFWLSTQQASEKHAIDIDINPIYDGIIYRQGDATNLPYEDGFFDRVFAFDVIEHVELGSEQKFVQELIRVTKNGGEILLTTPSRDIKLFPVILTNWISKKWLHFKCNGYEEKELIGYIGTNYETSILKLDSRGYLNLYLLLRLLWILNKTFTKKIIDKVAQHDAKVTGTNGYIFVSIKK